MSSPWDEQELRDAASAFVMLTTWPISSCSLPRSIPHKTILKLTSLKHLTENDYSGSDNNNDDNNNDNNDNNNGNDNDNGNNTCEKIVAMIIHIKELVEMVRLLITILKLIYQ